jgi:hypothetical protein
MVFEWSASTRTVSTLAPSGLDAPAGVAVDGNGNVYIADTFNHALKKWSPAAKTVSTLASGLSRPDGVAVDGSGNVYIADYAESAIKMWSAPAQTMTTLLSQGLKNPEGVAVDGAGNVYIADTMNQAIKEITFAFVGPASLSAPATAGYDSLLPVLPSTVSLAGVFAPASDQGWLTIGTISNGVLNFSFTANTSGSSRTAHIAILGQQIAVTQSSGGTTPAGACDVTGDNVANVADVQRLIKEALGAISAGDDLNKDGSVNVADIQIVIDAATGMVCTAK